MNKKKGRAKLLLRFPASTGWTDVPLFVDDDLSIIELKEQIFYETGIEENEQVLYYDRRALLSSKMLSDYALPQKAVIRVEKGLAGGAESKRDKKKEGSSSKQKQKEGSEEEQEGSSSKQPKEEGEAGSSAEHKKQGGRDRASSSKQTTKEEGDEPRNSCCCCYWTGPFSFCPCGCCLEEGF
ncbi:hypothetical protein QOT17_018953 [Balamuthia mandrillaris]